MAGRVIRQLLGLETGYRKRERNFYRVLAADGNAGLFHVTGKSGEIFFYYKVNGAGIKLIQFGRSALTPRIPEGFISEVRVRNE